MDMKVVTLLVILLQLRLRQAEYITGIITNKVTFFYRKLPVDASLRATVEFNVSYLQSSMRGRRPFPWMGLHTNYPKIDIDKGYSYIVYEQLRNDYLRPSLEVGRYLTTTCELSGADTVNCRGRVNIQDYIPRTFSLSFGFECRWMHGKSLKGLRYSISFSNQSNETNNCIDFSTRKNTRVCSEFYHHTSFPNLIGQEHMEPILEILEILQFYEMITALGGKCYQHTEEILCRTLLPECDPVTQHVIHPCREMCSTFLDACLHIVWSMGAKVAPKYGRKFSKMLYDNVHEVACDYLPSLNDSIPCFYKPVTCNFLPDVTNSTRTLNSIHKDVYQLHEVVQYACINETSEIRGTDSITCLYSGEWSNPLPKCVPVKQVRHSSMSPVLIILPILLLPLFIVIIIIGIKRKRKVSPELKEERIQLDSILTQFIDNDEPLLLSKRKQESTLSLDIPPSPQRRREFDAFVLYHFDTDHDFVVNSLIPELEETRNLRLIVHSRCFQPGRKIEENIEDAIESSNNAIILMSSGFTTSRWCVDEFTHCYIEHVEDPSFKLFVIMMEAVGGSIDLTPNMRRLLTEETYLEVDDPELYPRLASHLRPDNDADISDNNEQYD